MAVRWLQVAALVGFAACGRVGFGSRLSPDGKPAVDTPVGDVGSFVTPALVWSDFQQVSSSGNVTLVIQPVPPGDLLVAGITLDSASPVMVSGVTDDGGDVFTSACARAVTNGVATEIWYAQNAAGGASSVTAMYSAAASGSVMWVAEFSGIDTSAPLDDAAMNVGLVSAMIDGAGVATMFPHELVFSVLDSTSGNVTAIVSGNPFILLQVASGDDAAYTIAGTPGTYAATWDVTGGTGNECSSTAAFKPAPR